MKKKLIISLSVISIVAAVAIGGTIAFFTDTETSTGNVFTAGAIDLKIDNESYVTDPLTGLLAYSKGTSWGLDKEIGLFFNFTDLKPGDMGEDTVSIHVDNNDAWACVTFKDLVSAENTCTEPEGKAEMMGDEQSEGCDYPEGELAEELQFVFWIDDGDNVYEAGEDILTQGLASDVLNGVTYTLADSLINNVGGANGTPLTGAKTYYIGKFWCYGTLTEDPLQQDGVGVSDQQGPIVRDTGFTCDGLQVGNKSQTDSLTGTVEFYAEQARNNGQFICGQQVCVPVTETLFEDGFESGSFSEWDSHSGSWQIVNEPAIAHEGSYYALTIAIYGSEGEIVKTLSTVDYENIALSYYYRILPNQGLESNDHVYIEYSTNGGSNWNEIEEYTNQGATAGWIQETFILSGAENLSNLKIRFRSNMYADNIDAIKFDDVEITGDTICD